MRRALVIGMLSLAPACLISTAPPDGAWSSMEKPCVPAAEDATQLAVDEWLDGDHFALGGDTILYGSNEVIKQVHVTGGEPAMVAMAYRGGQLGVIANNLVYTVDDDRGTLIILDRGLQASTRWETLGRTASGVASLIVIPTGVYWSHTHAQLDWRWSPSVGVAYFGLRTSSQWIETDGTDFWFVSNDALWLKPATGGDPQRVMTDATAVAVAIDSESLYLIRRTPGQHAQLIALSRSTGTERILATLALSRRGALGGGYFYWSDVAAPHEIWRVPVTGGQIEIVHRGNRSTMVQRILTDACNAYWTAFEMSSFDNDFEPAAGFLFVQRH